MHRVTPTPPEDMPDDRARPSDSTCCSALLDENAVLTRELARAQQRTSRLMAAHTQRTWALQADIMRLRGQLVIATTVAALLHDRIPPLRPQAAPGAAADAWANRSVLCVDGRLADLPVYRRFIEIHGGRFLHHDGGTAHSASQLEATLAAADLVICQAGCISHNAYWRVQDHCKRTGKRCVLVATPNASNLQQVLADTGSDA